MPLTFHKEKPRFMGLWLLLMLLLSVTFFELIPLQGILSPNQCFGYQILLLFILFTFYNRTNIWEIARCMKPVWWILAGVALSFVSANMYYHQNYMRSILTNRHMLVVMALPVIYAVKPTLREIRFAFNAFSVIFLVTTIVATFILPGLLPVRDQFQIVQEEDFVRTLPGIRLIVIAMILSMNECRKKLTIGDFFWTVFQFGIVFLVQNRTSLLAAVIILFIGIRTTRSASGRMIGSLLGVFLAFILLFYTASQWDFLIQQTIDELSDPEYNRNRAYSYMFAHRQFYRIVLGDGFISAFTHPIMELLREQGIYHSDVGLIGVWNQYGIVTAGTMLVMIAKGLSSKKNYIVNATAVYFLVGTISLSYFTMAETMIPFCLFLYFYYMSDVPGFDTQPVSYSWTATGQRYRSINQ